MELNRMVNWQGLIKEYAEYLPVSEDTPRLTLHEGDTPLIRLDTLSEKYGSEIYAKYEGANPTGSFKDRGMVMAEIGRASCRGTGWIGEQKVATTETLEPGNSEDISGT